MGEKHAIVMAGFTAAALAAAFGINLLVRQRTRKRSVLVDSVSIGENKGLYCCESEESLIVSEIFEDHQEETRSVISEPPSEAASSGMTDCKLEPLEENLVELREKERAKENEELERLNSCMKELEERVMKLSLQEAEINELKKRVNLDEEKIEKLNLQEVEIIELKKKIKNDENQIQKLQEEVAMLRDMKNKKKSWWNKDASVHNAVAPVHVSRKNKLK